MRKLVCVVVACLVSPVAWAQPAGAPPPADPTAGQPPTDPNQGLPPVYPNQGQPPPGQPPYGQPYPGQPYPSQPYPGQPAPYPQQPPAPPDEDALRKGATVELNLGFGWIRVSDDNTSDTSDLALGGLDLGVGGWVNPKVAISGRIAGVTYSKGTGRLTDGFFGPSIQFWPSQQFFVGGGIGLGFLAASDTSSSNSDSIAGIAADLRAGVKLNSGTENTFNVSVELNPGHYTRDGSSATVTAIALLVGYQHL